MISLKAVNLLLFMMGAGGLFLVFAAYPLLLIVFAMLSSARRTVRTSVDIMPLSVCVVVAVRNGQTLISEKIDNTLALNYPPEHLEVVVISDGSTDGTAHLVRSHPRAGNIRFIELPEHSGKASAINQCAEQFKADVLVFSDADALLDKQALRKLLKHFSDATVGGVGGQRKIGRDTGNLKGAQKTYLQFDALIKKLESRVKCVVSNDGKLYAIRSELFRPIVPSATDDLYACLSVIRQGFRFIYEPEAIAFIRTPSRTARHELGRRRRVVCRSLSGIWTMRELLNPFHYPFVAIALLINKVLRRLLPICLVLLLISSAFLSFVSLWFFLFLLMQFSAYVMAAAYPALEHASSLRGPLYRVSGIAFYFCIGMAGTALGVLDFLRGQRATKWEPVKADTVTTERA